MAATILQWLMIFPAKITHVLMVFTHFSWFSIKKTIETPTKIALFAYQKLSMVSRWEFRYQASWQSRIRRRQNVQLLSCEDHYSVNASGALTKSAKGGIAHKIIYHIYIYNIFMWYIHLYKSISYIYKYRCCIYLVVCRMALRLLIWLSFTNDKNSRSFQCSWPVQSEMQAAFNRIGSVNLTSF